MTHRSVIIVHNALASSNSPVEVIERLEVSILLTHNIALDPPREPSAYVVLDESACRDSKDLGAPSVSFDSKGM